MNGRFQVRPSHSELGPTLYRVFDTQQGRFVAIFTRAQLAENCALRWEQDARAELFAPAEAAS